MPLSGKSTLGKELALALSLEFFDLDQLIVDQEGIDIMTIFKEKGEPYFRQAESNVLESIELQPSRVISLGGGTPIYHNGMDYIMDKGISLYLHVTPERLIDRYHKANNTRPLFETSNLDDNLEKLYRERLPIYSKALLTVNNMSSIQQSVEEIIKTLKYKNLLNQNEV